MQRYFLPPDAREGQMARIVGADFHHLARVMRMQPGAVVEIVAGGEAWRASVESVDLIGGVAHMRLHGRLDQSRESRHPVTLVQGLAKGDKIDSIVRQACEIGVTRIILFRAQRSVADLPADRVQGRLDRWRKIAKESCETAHRDKVPEILFAASCQTALAAAGWTASKAASEATEATETTEATEATEATETTEATEATEASCWRWLLVPYESQTEPLPGLRAALHRLQGARVDLASTGVQPHAPTTGVVAPGSATTGSTERPSVEVAMVIGPEGGFADEEIELLKTYGAALVTLGPRILRTETAGVVAVACVLYELGELENRVWLQTSQEEGVSEHVDA